jgi:putative FmdB family regulatory protein
MPVYEYGCEAGHRFEVKQKMSDAPIMTCQVCNLPVSKLISAPAISFKGSGWYITDYSDKMKPSATDEKSEKPAASADSKKDSPQPSPAGKDAGGAAQPPSSNPAPRVEPSTSSASSPAPTTPASSTPSRPPSEK